MGKQKRSRRKNNKNKPAKPVDSSLPAVLQRLRHANQEIREATIYGLSTAKQLDFPILQELRDQVKTSAAAADILISHLHDERTASWWSTFIACVRDGHNVLPCLKCCVELLENNPIVRDVDADVPLLLGIALSDEDMTCSNLAAQCLHAISETSDICRDHVTAMKAKLGPSVRGLHLLGVCINLNLDVNPQACIRQALEAFHTDSLERITKVYERHETCLKDKTLEDEIVRKQDAKKEPARHIARRLKQEGMDVDGDVGDKRGGDMSTMDRTDVESDWNAALSEWESLLVPIELALELLANITLQHSSLPDCTPALILFMQKLNVQVSIPPAIHESIVLLSSKAGTCAGNLLLGAPNEQLWKCLQLATPTAPVLAAQAMVLKQHSRLPVDSWDSYISLVRDSSDDDVVREAIVLLSTLCTSGPHPVDLNRAVASAIVQCNSSSGPVLTERLNALMDVYGDDDCHPIVFEEQKLLDFVKTHRKILKERINLGSIGSDDEEIAVWKEAVENAGAFVAYKEDQEAAIMDTK